jgi:hypothetical protein
MASVIVIAAAIAIPLLLRNGGDDATATTATTASSTAVSAGTVTSSTAPPTTAVASGAPGDSSGEWAEVSISGGPWSATNVAVSDDALLLHTSTGAGYRLYAIMLGSGDEIELTEAEAQWGMDIDGLLAVWWEAAGWDDATETYAEQHIYSCLLPGDTKTEIAGGGAVRKTLPQVAQSLVTWVEGTPWPDNPAEYQSQRIYGAVIDANGVPTGVMSTLVSSALAFVLGDSTWQYSLSNTRLAWETGVADGGYDVGTHVNSLSTVDHVWVGGDAWRPSLWGDTLVYWDSGLKVTDLAAAETHDVDASGDFATAGPTFAAYYRSGSGGSQIVARGYGGSYEQVLGVNPDPPYWCPVIAVSPRHIAFTIGSEVHLFEWQAH